MAEGHARLSPPATAWSVLRSSSIPSIIIVKLVNILGHILPSKCHETSFVQLGLATDIQNRNFVDFDDSYRQIEQGF